MYISSASNITLRSYCNGPAKVIERLADLPEPSSRNKQHDYERVLKRQLETLLLPRRLPQWSSAQTTEGLASRRQHIDALAQMHHQTLTVLCEIISQFGRLQSTTKTILVEGSSLEMMIMRAAFLQVNTRIFDSQYSRPNIYFRMQTAPCPPFLPMSSTPPPT